MRRGRRVPGLKSKIHHDTLFAYKALKQLPVTAHLSNQVLRNQKCHIDFLMTDLPSLRYPMQQGLAVSTRKRKGSLYQLSKCQSDDVPGLSNWLNNGQYLSHKITAELIGMIAHKGLSNTLSEVHAAEWFGIIGDET